MNPLPINLILTSCLLEAQSTQRQVKFFAKAIVHYKSHNRTERDTQGVGRDILIPKKNYADGAETASGKLIDFRKTPFHDSARESEAASTNKKNGSTSGGTMRS